MGKETTKEQGNNIMATEVSAPANIRSHFTQSFRDLAGIKVIGYQNTEGLRLSKTRVGIDLVIRADEDMVAFMKRLPRANKEVRKVVKRVLRTVVRTQLLPELRQQIPKRQGKVVERVSRDKKIHRTKRGRTQVYGRRKHLRTTARISKVETDRVVVVVGNADLWYGAALHARVPFYPRTIAKVEPRLNKVMETEMRKVLNWVGSGKKTYKYG